MGGAGSGGTMTAGGGSGGSSGAGGSSGKGGGPQVGTECGGIAIPMGTGGPSGGALGTWTNVTPAAISLAEGNDNFGVQDILVDPVRPNDFYGFVCHQGVYKSTDYGQTWTKINTGQNGDRIDSGKPWGEGIDSNRCRDPNTPPTLYSAGSQNQFWKSTNGGVDWTGHDLPNDGKDRPQDVYDVDVDPYDGTHLLAGFHEENGLAHSTDGGETWSSVTLDAGMDGGVSWYPFFIDTGDPETTRNTWIDIPQAGGPGTWRTTNGGQSWTRVDGNTHNHGASQIFQYQGVVYMAGVYSDLGWGVLRSTDFGASWERVGPYGAQTVVYGTPNYVYAQASLGADQANAIRGAQPGTEWAVWPLTMSDGPKRAAVSYDGSNHVIVGGNWLAGIWRYVEP
jgi:hypothetical protein